MKNLISVIESEKIINRIVFSSYKSIEIEFDNFVLRGECNLETKNCTAGLIAFKNGRKIDFSHINEDFIDLDDVVQLCDIMKDEDGKSWTSFVLTYENGGEANIKYDYNPLPEE